jgi:hypothetical protein
MEAEDIDFADIDTFIDEYDVNGLKCATFEI